MAYYAALVSLVQLLEDIIHRDRYPNLLLHKQYIASVHEKFSLLQKLLDDYSPKDRETADSLERRIRDAAYLAQDIIESHISDRMRQYLSEKNEMPQQLEDFIESEIQVHRKDKIYGIKRALRHLISAFKKALNQLLQAQRCGELRLNNVSKEHQDLENVKELEEVKEEADSIVEELMRIKESHTIEDNLRLNYYPADPGTLNQASGTNTIVGFEEDLATLKGELCGEQSKLQVVSIVGMGGIGKTTLARKVFNDGLIVYKFDCHAWVTVSQDYHQQKVLPDILHSMNIATDKSSEVGELEEKIYKHLKGRRYFIIMDDIWDTKIWDEVKRFLPDDSNGSKIMITTRISDVAFYADRFGFCFQMELLNENQSWNLFREKMFCPPELEDIGRLIAKNCSGLPLAIVVVAGLLSNVNKERCAWEEIARNICSVATENDEHFSKILSLSYNHLPHHLKPLFLYIGGFPEDHQIRVSRLVKLWIAEGLLKPIEYKSLEAVVEEYLEDLINRNLVLITKKGSNGKIKRCGIHDLLRDLCTEIISYENFLHVLDEDSYLNPTTARNVCRLFIRGDFPFQSQFKEAKQIGSFVHSIISDTVGLQFLFFTSGSKLLRVLDVKGPVTKFSTEILELFHLRHLTFAGSYISKVPPSISLPRNLETLIVISASRKTWLCSLPRQIQDMPNLRHIMSRGLYFECRFFDERIVGKSSILENLQTLSWVSDVRFNNEVIKMIPNLQKLKGSCYEEASEWQNFHLKNLFHLRQLATLNIDFSNTWRRELNTFPENFAFPLTLKKLLLSGCRLPWKAMMVVASLPNLRVLKLRADAFAGEKWKPVEGEFSQLKYLLIECLDLMYWQVENSHFPRLQHLKINQCRWLQEVPLEIGEISTLELIEVIYSKSAAESALRVQEEQRDMGNDVLQVYVYPQYENFRFPNKESYSNKELREEAVGSKDEIQEEDGSDRGDEIQEINPVN